MIVWSGKGIFIFLILAAACLIFVGCVFGEEQAEWGFALAFLVAGAAAWLLGNQWDSQPGKTMIDKATGQEVVFRSNDTFFWIKAKYWGPIFGCISLIFLGQALFA